MRDPAAGLLAIGLAVMDLELAGAGLPSPGTKGRALSSRLCCGGPAARAALAAAARRSWPVRLAAGLGADDAGVWLRNLLSTSGVELLALPQPATPCAAVIIHPDGERSIINTEPLPMTPAQCPDLATWPAAALILADGRHSALACHLRERWQVPLLLDAGSANPGVLALLPQADYVLASAHCVRQLGGFTCLREAAPQARLWACTEGAAGGVWQEQDSKPCRWAAPAVLALNTSGAGDVFHGIFAWALLQGLAFPAALQEAANAAAAHVAGPAVPS